MRRGGFGEEFCCPPPSTPSPGGQAGCGAPPHVCLLGAQPLSPPRPWGMEGAEAEPLPASPWQLIDTTSIWGGGGQRVVLLDPESPLPGQCPLGRSRGPGLSVGGAAGRRW